MVATLEGQEGGGVSTADGRLSVNINAFVQAVKERLVQRGFTLAERIPETDATFVLVEDADLEKAQRAYRVIEVARWVLPALAVAAAAGTVAVARRKHRAAAATGLAVVGGVALVTAAIQWAARHYAGSAGVLPYDASLDVYRALLGGLSTAMKWLAAIGLLTTTVAVLTAPGPKGLPAARLGAVALAALGFIYVTEIPPFGRLLTMLVLLGVALMALDGFWRWRWPDGNPDERETPTEQETPS